MDEDDLLDGDASNGEASSDGPSGKTGPVRVEVMDDVGDGDSEAVDPVVRLEEEIAELRDRSIRTLADFDNYRKRIERERRDERRFAALETYRRVLDVVDNLERALGAGGSAEDLKTGVEMILRQIQELLRSGGVNRVPAVGQPFDPNVHEAVARFEDSEVEEPTVSDEMQAGYRMHERLIRPAIVRVAMPPESDTTDPAGGDDEPEGPPPIH